MRKSPITSIKSAPVDEPAVTLDAELDATKVGRRNNKEDQKRVQTMHDTSVEMGAMCGDGGKKSGSSKAADANVEEDDETPGLEIKPVDLAAVPLDTIVSDVRSAFWELRKAERIKQNPEDKGDYDSWEWDDSMCPECVAVYNGYAIAKVGLAFFQVPFTLDKHEIDLAPMDQWKQVEQSWVAKSVPASVIKAWRQREAGCVKSLGGGRVGNYLVLWGNEEQRDLYNEYFDKERTQGLKAIFDYIGKVPALYQHAMDGKVKYSPVGVIDTMEIDEIGLWTETQLDLANAYAREIQKLARKRALGASSGTLPGARKVAPDGCITQWPIIEGSFTPTPAEPRLRDMAVAEVKAIYTELGLEFPDTEIDTSADRGGEEPRSEAEIEAERERLRLLEL